MKYRKLRIAWSAVWGMAAVLLCVLWGRSYFCLDRIGFRGKALTSMNGRLVTKEVFNLNSDAMRAGQKVLMYNFGSLSFWTAPIGLLDPVGRGSRYHYWPWPTVALLFASAPFIPHRFSLRTLLIATTLVAVVLGIIVWLLRTG